MIARIRRWLWRRRATPNELHVADLMDALDAVYDGDRPALKTDDQLRAEADVWERFGHPDTAWAFRAAAGDE
jgi:hypothetical protein